MMMRVTWAAVMAEAKRKTTKNANISESEIQKHIGMIRNVLNNEPVVVEALRKSMSKYFKDLSLEKDTATLAAHIGNQAVKRHLCYRRNSSSLSAASVYLACQLQGMRTTQNSFCKIVGLTEVTLRKVYKELKNHWPQLVPDNYKPFRVPNGLKAPLSHQRPPPPPPPKRSTSTQQQPTIISSGAPSSSSSSSSSSSISGVNAYHHHRSQLSSMGGAGPLPPRTRPTHYGWKESTQRQQQQQQRKVVLVASKGYELVDGLQDFQVPKQYTSDGRDIWAKEEGGGGRRISDAAVELLQEYPRPKEVYAALSAQCSGSSSSSSSSSSKGMISRHNNVTVVSNKTVQQMQKNTTSTFPPHPPPKELVVTTPGTTRKLVTTLETNLIQQFDSFGNNIREPNKRENNM
mmetsp:Transcript_21057/g.33957  ORF Transcript_21057/g.33957 Transcript_21057/m.33957 type:complete len:403 (-) Transcript_21057:251-1459(-)